VGDVKLVAPRVRVIRDGQEPLEVQCDNRDLVGYEKTRLRRKPVWPAFNEAPFQWLTFISWSAARRSGAIDPSHTFERWESEVLSVADTSAEDTTEVDEELGRPTAPGPDPG
jgi:hypothetical protein